MNTDTSTSRVERPGVFLSHNRADKEMARRLAKDLRVAGARVWIDEAEIKVGDSLIEKIRAGLDSTDYVLALLSSASISSEWVRKELDIAMNQEIEGKRVKVLPLLLEDVDIPGFLKGKKWADMRSAACYPGSLGEILDRLGLPLTKDSEKCADWVEMVLRLFGWERAPFIQHATAHLRNAWRDTSILVRIEEHIRYRSAEQLWRYGALVIDDAREKASGFYAFRITEEGVSLLDYLELESGS